MALFDSGFGKCKSYIGFFVLRNSYLPKAIIISYLTTSYVRPDYPVHVDKHDSDKKFTPPTDPLGGVKGQLYNFTITKSVVNMFYRIFACRQRHNIYETYQIGF